MTIHEAGRTLLKSPPELWAECSDAASLARHLDQFGEIKITRLEPETAVAWEGECVSGTVRLEPSGWGTRVILTAEEVDLPDLGAPAERMAEGPETEERVDAEPESEELGSAEPGSVDAVSVDAASVDAVSVDAGSGEPGVGIVVAETADATEPVEPPEAHAVPVVGEGDVVLTSPATAESPATRDAAPSAPRKGLFARFLARMRGPEPDAAPPAAAKARESKPGSSIEARREKDVAPEQRVAPEPTVVPEPPVAPEMSVEPEPAVAPEPKVGPESAPQPQSASEVSAEPAPTPAASAHATEIALKDALESLGTAHHRPFSRP